MCCIPEIRDIYIRNRESKEGIAITLFVPILSVDTLTLLHLFPKAYFQQIGQSS